MSIRKLKAVHTLTLPAARLSRERSVVRGASGRGKRGQWPMGQWSVAEEPGAKGVAAGPALGQRSVEGFPCLVAEPALNVTARRRAGDGPDAEATLEGAPGGAQRSADAAGELMAALDAEADEDPEEGA